MQTLRNWLLAFLIASFGSQVLLGQTPGTAASFREARRVVKSVAPLDPHTNQTIHFDVTSDALHVHGTLLHRTLINRRLHDTYDEDPVLRFSDIASAQFDHIPNNGSPMSGRDGVEIHLSPAHALADYEVYWVGANGATAQQFVDALQWLISHASELKPDPAAAERFRAQAAAWRALADKPKMPEEVRTHKLLAENAVQEKNFDRAVEEYQTALQLFPMWPEGQFNLALICGETGDYECAVEHMQNYLELVPDASDAQAAKDKITIWKDKITRPE